MSSSGENGSRLHIGGQAIIEGVMMRSPDCVSAAVRQPDGEITQKVWPSRAWQRRGKIAGWPVVRGVVSLAEALVLGIRALNWSAEIAQEHQDGNKKRPNRKRDSLGQTVSLLLAIILAIAIFMFIPYMLASVLKTGQNQPLFHLVAGSTRLALFLAYIWAISLIKDIRRVFQYHGAEHQAIFTYEQGQELDPDNARGQSCLHPRCGTSFLLIVALLIMILFVLFDVLVVAIWGAYPNALIRLLVHLPFLPLVAGISYEFLRLSDRLSDAPVFRLLVAPGLALQRLTTRLPDDGQREVALVALKAAIPKADRSEALTADLRGEA